MFTKKYSWDGKNIVIEGPFNLSIEVDYDDVNHKEVDKETDALLRILNFYWVQGGNFSEYSFINSNYEPIE